MPTLQRFKLFATQCAAVNIPTQSPTTSPLFHLNRQHRRRRKTLRMLLTGRTQISDPESNANPKPQTAASVQKRSKLKDLFFSAASSSPTSLTHHRRDDDDQDEKCSRIGPVRTSREIGPKLVRPVVQPFGFRNRMLLRKAWRPVLSTIEELPD